jgi:RND family efflux transporter MFP subunit
MRPTLCILALALALSPPAFAETMRVEPTTILEWKAVYGRIEARTTVPARARIGGSLIALEVTEGDVVKAGQRVATVRDEKFALQARAIDAQLSALKAQRDNARAELARGQQLVQRGVTTAQRLDQLRTQVDVVEGQIAAAEAQKDVIIQQGAEGDVLAPLDGRVLTVPVTQGGVVMPGEPVATIAGGGFFLRLAIPERHAAMLREGATLEIEAGPSTNKGRLAKLYPLIENGRVIADVEVADIPTAFVDARVLVRVPVGERQALMVPAKALTARSGLDFLRLKASDGEIERVVVPGEREGDRVEILSGLTPGDEVIIP